MPILFLLMLPVLEIYLMIKIGAEIGALAVVIWLVGAAIFGVNILRYLGATAMLNAVRQMQTGAPPAQMLADALVKAIAAVLLIVPGFASDFLAILLFIPPIRQLLLQRWLRKFALKSSFRSADFNTTFNSSGFGGNVYDHKGSARDINEDPSSGRILEHQPDKKD